MIKLTDLVEFLKKTIRFNVFVVLICFDYSQRWLNNCWRRVPPNKNCQQVSLSRFFYTKLLEIMNRQGKLEANGTAVPMLVDSDITLQSPLDS